MKIRYGFVSNSSSSSFVVILPENFNPSTFVITENVQVAIDNENNDVEESEKEFRATLYDFVHRGGICEDDSYFSAISEAVSEYKVGTLDGSSGYGQIIILNREKVKQALEKTV